MPINDGHILDKANKDLGKDIDARTSLIPNGKQLTKAYFHAQASSVHAGGKKVITASSNCMDIKCKHSICRYY